MNEGCECIPLGRDDRMRYTGCVSYSVAPPLAYDALTNVRQRVGQSDLRQRRAHEKRTRTDAGKSVWECHIRQLAASPEHTISDARESIRKRHSFQACAATEDILSNVIQRRR